MYLYIPLGYTSSIEEVCQMYDLPYRAAYTRFCDGHDITGPSTKTPVHIHTWSCGEPSGIISDLDYLEPWNVASMLSERYGELYAVVKLRLPVLMFGGGDGSKELVEFLGL